MGRAVLVLVWMASAFCIRGTAQQPRPAATEQPRAPAEFAYDKNQEYVQNGQRAQSLGAELLVQGSFAAIVEGIGITLMASGRVAGGESCFGSAGGDSDDGREMQAVRSSLLPQRPMREGVPKASIAGIGSPVCCFVPEYTYVAKAKKITRSGDRPGFGKCGWKCRDLKDRAHDNHWNGL